MNQDSIYKGWMWDMFRDYVRKITRTASTGAMPLEELEQRYNAMHQDFEIKTMVSDKVGMIIQFIDLEMYQFQDFKNLAEESAFLDFLYEKYGQGKYKVNLYYNGTFVATKNFTTREGPEKWREILKRTNT